MLGVLFSNVYVALVVILFFGVTIFIHELGHYLVARWCGLVVKVFSIGFGPPIWKREVNGVLYKIGWIPFGGYVALPQLDPTAMDTIQGSDDSDASSEATEPVETFPRVSAWKKILVSLAGATGNIILAFVIAWSVYLIGMPATTANEDTVLGYVSPDCAAYTQGLRMGDRITSVNGTSVTQWSQFIQEAAMFEAVELDVVSAEGASRAVSVETEEWKFGVRMVGGVDARRVVKVGKVTPGMSAEDAGVLKDDVITSFAGQPVLSRPHLISLVAASVDQSTAMEVERIVDGDSVVQALTVTPAFDAGAQMPRIGIVFDEISGAFDSDAKIHPRPMKQLKHHAAAIFRLLHDLVTPKTAGQAAKMVGGPVAIISYYVGMIKASLMLAVWFTGFLNVNLAIINLLPIPVLDGGHIIFSLVEMVTGKPLKARIVNALVNVFGILIITVFALLSLRDVGRTEVGQKVQKLFQRETATNLVEEAVLPE